MSFQLTNSTSWSWILSKSLPQKKYTQYISLNFANDETRLSLWIPESFNSIMMLSWANPLSARSKVIWDDRILMLAVSIKDRGSWQHLNRILTQYASIRKLSVIISFNRRSCKYQLLKSGVSLQLNLLQNSDRSTRYTSSSLLMPRHIYQRQSASPFTSSRKLCVGRRSVSSLIRH